MISTYIKRILKVLNESDALLCPDMYFEAKLTVING